MTAPHLPIFDAFSALSDRTRCRVLWLLERQELTVSELCAVLQLPQSTVSRQLKILSDAGWVASRRDGTSRYYALSLPAAEEAPARLWELTRAQLEGGAGASQDARRLAQVLARRTTTSERFFATSSSRWDAVRAELFGSEGSYRALLGLLPSDWTIADLGCGTGAVLSELAPYVGRVIGVDGAEEMLAAARERVADLDNVELRQGTLEALPLPDASVDAVVMALVLHHLSSPVTALQEARRILRSGGKLLVIDMAAHEREEYRQQMGHVWLGFSEEHIHRLLDQAGFSRIQLHALPPAGSAKGPSLFATSAEPAVGVLPVASLPSSNVTSHGSRLDPDATFQ